MFKFIRINLANGRKQVSEFYTFDIQKTSNSLFPSNSAIPQWFAAT
jgi:hypothetical protein